MPRQIFISYARVSDLVEPGDEKGWVSTLVDFLTVRLTRKLGAGAVDFWKDDRLGGNEPLTETLQRSVAQSAIFIMVSSEPYLASEWCSGLELPEFLSKKFSSRIFRVEVEKIDRSRFPKPLRNVIGYKFWEEDPQSKIVRLLKGMPQRFADYEFFTQLNKLEDDLLKAIKALPETAGKEKADVNSLASSPPQSIYPPNGPAIFLANVPVEYTSERVRFLTYMNQSQVRVLESEPLPFEHGPYLEALEAALNECVLFVQLLSAEPIVASRDDPASDVGLQLQMAQKLGKAILQWRDPTLEIATVSDDKHRALLQANTVEQMGIEEFKAFVAKRALAKPIKTTTVRETPEGSLINGYVFLDRAIEDIQTAQPILDFLDELKVDCVVPLAKGDPQEIRVDLEENLSACEALIIVYGDAAPGWVRAQVRQYRKAKRDRPLGLQGIYEGPPETKDDLGLAMPALKIIPCRDGFASDKLLEFLKEQ